MKRLVRITAFTVMWMMLISLTSLGAQDENGVDTVVVIDTSGSMNDTDPDRISVDAAKLFIDMMEISGSRAGVVPFSDKLGTVTELTPMNSVSDKNKVKDQISGIRYQGDTDIGMAAQEGVRLLREAQDIDNQQMLLLFTDGTIDLTGADEAQREADSLEKAKAAAVDAQNGGIPIYTIGLNANGKVDQALLTDMAVKTGGRSYVVDSAGELPRIFNEIFADFVNSNIVNLGEYETDGVNFTEIGVDIPNDSVMEANIIMLSVNPLTEVEMTDPDGNVLKADGSKMILSRSDQYNMLKLVMPKAGNWKLRIKSAKGCKVHVNMIFNYKVSLKGSAQLETDADGSDMIAVEGYLEKEGVVLEDQTLYQQFTGSVVVADGDGAQHIYPLTVNGCSFEGRVPITDMGTYKIILRIDSDTMYRESEEIEISIENHAPIITKELENPIELKGFFGFTVKKRLDLNQYFTDPDGDELTFEMELRDGYGKGELNEKGELTLTPSKNGEDLLTVRVLDNKGLSVSRQVPVTVRCTIMGILPLIPIPVVLLVLLLVLLKIKRAVAANNAVWYGKIRWLVVKGTGFGGGNREQVYDMGYERGTVLLGRIVTDPAVSGMDLNKVILKMNGKTNSSIYVQNRSKKCRMSGGFGSSETAAIELNSGDFVMLAGESEGMEITVKVTYSLTAH